jgi:hypothetical protein
MFQTQAYMVAVFQRNSSEHFATSDPRDCKLISVDCHDEAYPLVGSGPRLFALVVARGVARNFEDACRDAVKQCMHDRRLSWMLTYLVPKSRRYMIPPCTHPHPAIHVTEERINVTRCSACDVLIEQELLK